MKKLLVVFLGLIFVATAPAQLTIGGAVGPAFGGGSFGGGVGFNQPGFAGAFAFPGFGLGFPGFGFSNFGFGFPRFGFFPGFRALRSGQHVAIVRQFPFGAFNGFGGFGFGSPFAYGGYGYGYGYPEYPGYGMPAASPIVVIGAPSGTAYQPEQPYKPHEAKPVTKEYKPGSLPPAPQPLQGPKPQFSIALTNNTVDNADAAWVQNGALYYLSGSGAQKCVPLSQIDRSATERLNAQKGLTLWLPPVG
jgi:hypothetical protein